MTSRDPIPSRDLAHTPDAFHSPNRDADGGVRRVHTAEHAGRGERRVRARDGGAQGVRLRQEVDLIFYTKLLARFSRVPQPTTSIDYVLPQPRRTHRLPSSRVSVRVDILPPRAPRPPVSAARPPQLEPRR